jgi:hypothetical protein
MSLLISHVFQLGGPFEELANVLIVFVALQLARMAIGAVAIRLCDVAIEESERCKKIATNAFYAVYYSVAVAMGLYLFHITGWADRSTICSHEESTISLSKYTLLHVYHCMQVAFYLNYLFAMISGIDNRRKDQWAFQLHHVITIFLILYSRNWGYMRMQLAIFVLHDAADPLLHIAKLAKATTALGKAREIVADVILIAFALSFFVTRWFVYPVYLIDSCRAMWAISYPLDWTYVASRDTPLLIQLLPDALVLVGWRLSYYGLSMLLLYVLFGLHMYWGAYILRIAWKKFLGVEHPAQEQQDIRKSKRTLTPSRKLLTQTT